MYIDPTTGGINPITLFSVCGVLLIGMGGLVAVAVHRVSQGKKKPRQDK